MTAIGRNGSGSTGCGYPAAAIRNGIPPSNDQGTLSGLVPDDVASVTLRFPAAGRRAAVTATAHVHGNVYAVFVPQLRSEGPGNETPPVPTIVWRSAQSRVVKTIRPPGPGARARYCRRNPVPCLLLETSSAGGTASGESSSASPSSTTATAAPPKTTATSRGG